MGMLALIVAVVALLALACGSNATATPRPTAVPQATATAVATKAPTATAVPQIQYGGTLRHANNLALQSFDPTYSRERLEALTLYVMYDRLVKLNPDMTVGPELAQSWTIAPGGASITFTLRRGIKFHDGTDFNADIVKWELERCLDPKVVCSSVGKIDQVASVSKVDDYTVTVNLKRPWRPALPGFAVPEMSMPSKAGVEKFKSYDQPNGDFGKNPIGTGPFVFKEWKPSDHVTVTKNATYWQSGQPYMDSILFQHAPDTNVMFAMLRTGETDIIDSPQRDQLAIIKDDTNLKTSSFDTGRVYIIRLLSNKPPLDNKALRQAIGFAIDRQALINSLYGGAGRPAYSTIGQGWAFNPDIKPIVYDVNKAKQKLQEAGYTGQELKYRCSSAAQSVALCEATQAMLKAAGMNPKIDLSTPADFFTGIREGNYALGDGFRTPLPDPHLLISEMYQKGGRGNYTGYSNPQVDSLLEQAGAAFDTAAARKLYDQVQQIVAEDATTIYKMWSTEYVAMSKKVNGYIWYPDLDSRFDEIWLSK